MTVEPSAVPPPIAAYAPGSFALFTVQHRLPKILAGVRAQFDARGETASLVVAKGDLHYRRFFDDRAWPAHAPVEIASVVSGINAYALRVLKSDSIVGLEPSRAAQLFDSDPRLAQ